MLPMTSLLINWSGSPVSQLGSKYVNVNRERKVVVSIFSQKLTKGSKQCKWQSMCTIRYRTCACVSGKISLNPSPVRPETDLTSKSETVNLPVNSCVANAHSVVRFPQKKGVIPNYCHNYTEIKYVKDLSCVGHLSSVNLVTNVPNVAIDLPVGARLHQFWKKMGSPGGKSQGGNST